MKLIAVSLLFIANASLAAPILIGKSQLGETYAKPEDVQVIEDGYRYVSISNVAEGFAHSKGLPVRSIEYIYEIRCSVPLQRLVRAISFKNEWGRQSHLPVVRAYNMLSIDEDVFFSLFTT
jgi:hypothetical protein